MEQPYRYNDPSPKMKKFLEEIDKLCWEYGFEIWSGEVNGRNQDGTYPTFTIHGEMEQMKLVFIDGDGIDLE